MTDKIPQRTKKKNYSQIDMIFHYIMRRLFYSAISIHKYHMAAIHIFQYLVTLGVYLYFESCAWITTTKSLQL